MPKIFCITADNASNNGTMSKVLEQKLSEFKADQHMLGCVGHVINLAAKAALKALDNLMSVDEVKKGKVNYLKRLFKYGIL